MAKLTKTLADKVEPPTEGYQIHWDEKIPGYSLRVTSNGVRSFVAQGRVLGKAVIVTIGRYGLFTEDQARSKAQKVLQQMRDGIDPRDLKRHDEAMKVTLGEVCTAYVERPGKLKQSTRNEYQRHVDKVFATWKAKRSCPSPRTTSAAATARSLNKGLRARRVPLPAPTLRW